MCLMMISCGSTTKVSQPIEAQERLLDPDSLCMVKPQQPAKKLETGSTNGDALAAITFNNYLWKQDRLKVQCLQNYVETVLSQTNKSTITKTKE